MYFESFDALLTMSGHGPYVWSAYGITAMTLVALVVIPLQQKRQRIRELRGYFRRSEDV